MTINKTFLAALVMSGSGAIAGGSGALECYRFAANHTDLGGPMRDDGAIARLCRKATDSSPAKCYDHAVTEEGASKEAAISICSARPCKCEDDEESTGPKK
jgi:hypothetical protein